jgi:tetratricopeptide (TPR) repeat protein
MMKREFLSITIVVLITWSTLPAQEKDDYSRIDIMLIRGEINRVIDTCRQILSNDSLNAEIYYKLGLAYQNILPDDKSFDCFLKAAEISSGNNLYNYMVAKGYYSKGKMKQAKTLLTALYSADTLNWLYAYYLTSIYMQDGMYDESIKIYKRFYEKDSNNYIILDKLGFANLMKKEYDDAIVLYNRSLAINGGNLSAIKNLSYLYASTRSVDTALMLLTRGIEIDSTDTNLYARRAALYFSRNSLRKASYDYQKILSYGDTSALYLKRIGLAYLNSLGPEDALEYLLKAYKIDSSDYEVSSYLGLCYTLINDLQTSMYYYNSIIKQLSPLTEQLGTAYILLANHQNVRGLFTDAINNYLKGNELNPDVNLYMVIANIYDEKLNNISRSIYYYQLFLNNYVDTGLQFRTEYIDAIKSRIAYLKKKKNPI